MLCLLYVHMYIVTCTCKPSSLRQERGPERSPFLTATLRGFLPTDLVEGSSMYITVHSTCGTVCAPSFDRLGDPNGPLFLCGTPGAPSSTTKGTRTVPFFIAALRGILYFDRGPRTRAPHQLFLDPGSTLL